MNYKEVVMTGQLVRCQEEGNCTTARNYLVAGLSLTAGAALGAAAMYFCDPNRGKARRKQMEQQAAGVVRRSSEVFTAKAEDLLNRAKGVVAKAGGAVACECQTDDEVIAGRVRSHLGHVTRHAHAIETEVTDGEVTLHGALPEEDRARLLEDVRGITGVLAVHDRLACSVPG
jgi:osmotically-inducible protein OsmY